VLGIVVNTVLMVLAVVPAWPWFKSHELQWREPVLTKSTK